jgi:hypothetical protein
MSVADSPIRSSVERGKVAKLTTTASKACIEFHGIESYRDKSAVGRRDQKKVVGPDSGRGVSRGRVWAPCRSSHGHRKKGTQLVAKDGAHIVADPRYA